MERWTRLVLRFRWPILAGWLVVLLAGGFAFTRLSSLLSNEFSVPGAESERARRMLERHFGDRSDGAFTVVFRVRDTLGRGTYVRLQRDLDRAARAVPDARPRRLAPAGRHLLYGDVVSTLRLAKAKGYTDDLHRALPHERGVRSYVTGQAAIQHDLDPIFSTDLRKGESIALPIALLVLLAVFGLSVAVTMPFLFAASTIFATLGAVYLFAHELTMATYVTNLLQLIVFWHWPAGGIVARPVALLAARVPLLGAAAIPVFALALTPGSADGLPKCPQSVGGFRVLKHAVGPGALSPTQIVVDSGRRGGAV